ncbi:MAG: hypothetical protein EXX96DRAFT_574173 [Benjaminiella poitrasii]|nr:MAG: hypothetical protein EXX96DRAFT_574173 [Benjaminiella poitrasii]
MDCRVLNIIQNLDFINLITQSVLNEDDRNLVLTSAELLANNFHLILYLSESHAILLGIQPNVTRMSLKQAIGKSLRVFEQYKIQPSVFILCTNTISPSLQPLLSSTSQNSHWQITKCSMWAEKFVIISNDATFLHDAEACKHLDPLVVLVIYFSGDENQIEKLLNVGNTTMQFVHSIQ